jgi:uncharacterized protein YegP (UPF0339 family)
MSAMQFVIYQDSGGLYHWRLVSEGIPIAVSATTFGSKEQARLAAVAVHMHAGGATGVAG